MSLWCYLEEVEVEELGLLGDLGVLNLSLGRLRKPQPRIVWYV